MSSSELAPLRAGFPATSTYNSVNGLNEVQWTVSSISDTGTLVGQSSTLPTLPNNPVDKTAPPRNWVPDPNSKDRARTLVLCFDGTGDQFDDDNSNVIQFLACLKKDDQSKQLVYYQAGIGTYTGPAFVTPLSSQISKTLDEMFAWNLGTHVQEGYEFLMQNYTAGDKISIFGFSRGAYTARALAGMVQKVGLLPSWNRQQLPFAYAMYVSDSTDGLRNSESFKQTFSIDVTIDFVGVWDTVASVGITNKELPFVGNNTAIRVFRHALALDEHRAKFMPNFYHASDDSEPSEATSSLNVTQGAGTIAAKTAAAATALPGSSGTSEVTRPVNLKAATPSERQLYEARTNSRKGPTDALEVWFAGCHCDVGGGSVRNGTRHALARIPLRWMIRQCFATKTGIIFDKDMLKDCVGIDAKTLYPEFRPRPEALPLPPNALIQQPIIPCFTVPAFIEILAGLVAIPLKFAFDAVTWPIFHLGSLVKFSAPVKWIRDNPVKWVRDKPVKWICDKLAWLKPKQADAPIVSEREDFHSEEEEDLHDALEAEYDQLAARWFWWVIELLPLKHREQEGKRDDYFVTANLGRGRMIYGDARIGGIKVHRTVKTRLEVLGRDGKSVYKPRAWFRPHDPTKHKKERAGIWNNKKPNSHSHWEWVG